MWTMTAAACSNSCLGEEFVTEHLMKSIAVLCFIRKPVYCLGFINWIKLAVCGQKIVIRIRSDNILR